MLSPGSTVRRTLPRDQAEITVKYALAAKSGDRQKRPSVAVPQPDERCGTELAKTPFHVHELILHTLTVGVFMFGFFSKQKNLTVHDIGHIIERFLAHSPRYPQEWDDFVKVKQRNPDSERLRQRCRVLSSSVNRPGDVDESALIELESVAASARKETYLDVAKMLADFVDGTGGRWDWDDYTSAMSYPDDPYLEEVQRRMINLDTEFPSGGNGYCGEGGIEVIRSYVRDLRHRAEEYGAAVRVYIP